MNDKIKDLYIVHELDEFLHIEKEPKANKSQVLNLIDQ